MTIESDPAVNFARNNGSVWTAVCSTEGPILADYNNLADPVVTNNTRRHGWGRANQGRVMNLESS